MEGALVLIFIFLCFQVLILILHGSWGVVFIYFRNYDWKQLGFKWTCTHFDEILGHFNHNPTCNFKY